MGVRREARDALAAAGLHPRKRWGQHFLCDPGVARRIVTLADVSRETAVLEIGPGLGALTDELAARAARLYLVEIDRGLAAELASRYAAEPRVQVLVGDVLALPIDALVTEPHAMVVANLPYGITTPVIFRLLALRTRFRRAVLMVQREVAERLSARPGTGDWGVTSVLVQTYAVARLAFGVSRRSFLPVPRVDSAVLTLDWHDVPRVDVDDPEVHRAVVRAAFGQRRKMLRNALADLATSWGLDGAMLLDACAASGIEARARAETLDLAAFGRLARALAARRAGG